MPPTKAYIINALNILGAMKGSGDWLTMRELYLAVLGKLPAHLVEPAISKLCGETWRPAPFDIVRVAAEIEMCKPGGTSHPYPTADEAYAEIMGKVRQFGLNAVERSEEYPPGSRRFVTYYSPGPPEFSHPLVARTVALIGGWDGICSGEANYAEGIAKQIKGCYERQAERWVQDAAEKLGLPPDQNRPWFPRWKPYRIAIDWSEPTEYVEPPVRSVRLVPPPRSVLYALKRVGVRLERLEGPDRGGELKRIAADLDPERMREVERDLADKASRKAHERTWKP